MGGTFAPPIKAPFVVAKEVLTRQYRVFFHPDDLLREVQARRLERRRVVTDVGVAAPNEEGPARLQHLGDVAEPDPQQPVELYFRDEIVGQGSVLGTQLARRR